MLKGMQADPMEPMKNENLIAIERREKRKDISKTVGIALEFIVIIMGVSIVLNALSPLDGNLTNIFVCIVAVVILYFQCRPGLPEGWPVKTGSKCSVWTFLTALGIVSLLQLVTALLSGGSKAMPGEGALYILYMGFLIPICEELVFRGFVLERFRKYGAVFAIAGSALLFGLYHCNAVQLVTGTLMGLLFGYLAMRYSIGCTILLHMINNGFYALILIKLTGALDLPALNIVIPGIFTLTGLVFFIKLKPVQQIKDYLNGNPTEKGTFKYLFLNGWFIAIVAALVLGTVLILCLVAPNFAGGQIPS